MVMPRNRGRGGYREVLAHGSSTSPRHGMPSRKRAPKQAPAPVRDLNAERLVLRGKISALRQSAGSLNPAQRGLFERFLGDLYAITAKKDLAGMQGRLQRLSIPPAARAILERAFAEYFKSIP
ncbi:MAG: hypothetical protein IPJ89_03725 [Candidatus Iainarchaeum archaeon]|uniref:Uncharacterized protein n=1 Tax=Candidatus Iainarchaeum sp. TaxID=3101447 RepID=A0A7T9I217_9ARCH|nr:MAG: hypothetical protein IPJ89_03725 [Candidatus Diapherotrites archaeon]